MMGSTFYLESWNARLATLTTIIWHFMAISNLYAAAMLSLLLLVFLVWMVALVSSYKLAS